MTEDQEHHYMGVAAATVLIVILLLVLGMSLNDLSKTRKQLERDDAQIVMLNVRLLTRTENTNAATIPGNCPAPSPAPAAKPFIIYRDRSCPAASPNPAVPLVSGRDEKSGDWARANELAKMADKDRDAEERMAETVRQLRAGE